MNPDSIEENSQNSKEFGDNNDNSKDSHMIYSPQTKEMKFCGKFIEIDSNDTNFNARKCNACGTITKSSNKEAINYTITSQNNSYLPKKQQINSNVQHALEESSKIFREIDFTKKNENSEEIDNNGTSTNSHMIYSPQTKEMKLCGKFSEIDSTTDTNYNVRKCDSCGTIVKNNPPIIRINSTTNLPNKKKN